MPALAQYEALAALFDYPDAGYPARVREVYRLLAGRYVLAAAAIDAFGRALAADDDHFPPEALSDVQEIFTRSFDVQAITTLAVGYVMFGDDYRRGELLVNLGREMREAGIDCGTELPDHLPNILRLLARWQKPELVREFVEEILHPSLTRMIAEFDTRRMKQREDLYSRHFRTLIVASAQRGSMFLEPLEALLEVLRQDFGLAPWVPPGRDNDFLGSISHELDIEANEGRPARPGRMP